MKEKLCSAAFFVTFASSFILLLMLLTLSVFEGPRSKRLSESSTISTLILSASTEKLIGFDLDHSPAKSIEVLSGLTGISNVYEHLNKNNPAILGKFGYADKLRSMALAVNTFPLKTLLSDLTHDTTTSSKCSAANSLAGVHDCLVARGKKLKANCFEHPNERACQLSEGDTARLHAWISNQGIYRDLPRVSHSLISQAFRNQIPQGNEIILDLLFSPTANNPFSRQFGIDLPPATVLEIFLAIAVVSGFLIVIRDRRIRQLANT